jgi:hypothetical protein
MSVLAVATVILLDKSLNHPLGDGNSGSPPLIVMDDFHDRQANLGILVGYGPSRYSGSFTSFEWGGRTLCTLPFSIYSVVMLLALLLIIATWAATGLIMTTEERKSHRPPVDLGHL